MRPKSAVILPVSAGIIAIVAPHHIPYLAQGTIGYWKDMVTKAQKAFACKGPTFLNVLSMCHRGWRFREQDTVKISKLAVETCFWPLYEVDGGNYRVTYRPKKKRPSTEWLRPQGRFRHLFETEDEEMIETIQRQVDLRWSNIQELAGA